MSCCGGVYIGGQYLRDCYSAKDAEGVCGLWKTNHETPIVRSLKEASDYKRFLINT